MRQKLLCLAILFAFALALTGREKSDLMPLLVRDHSLNASSKWTGEAIFIERCRDCHTVHATGGIVGPDLSKIGSQRDHLFLEQVIYNPSKIYPGTAMPPYDMLPVDQIKLVAGYLGGLH